MLASSFLGSANRPEFHTLRCSFQVPFSCFQMTMYSADVGDRVKGRTERVATDLDGCLALFVQLYGLTRDRLEAAVERVVPERPDVIPADHNVSLAQQ